VIRKVHIIGVLALGLMVTAVATAPASVRLVCSAQNFQQHFRDLYKAGSSLSPIERLVFSLVMANAKPVPHRS
jgi:hypothetical protein